ncbi:hypothetical protein ACA910_013614 [Epithemia clementina (nom. ined.)]
MAGVFYDRRRVLLITAAVIIWTPLSAAFLGCTLEPNPIQHHHRRGRNGVTAIRSSSRAVDGEVVDQLRKKSIRELKSELSQIGIPCDDVFEKEELVRRLSTARLSNVEKVPVSTSSTAANNNIEPDKRRTSASNVVATPLRLISLRGNEEVSVSTSEPGELKFRPTDQPFATIELEVSGSNSNNGKYSLNLMVDTACSGVVLKSSSVRKHQMPLMQTPVTSTGASGEAQNVGLAEIPNFVVGGKSFGRLPAAVQDLQVIPDSIDGIIGLSFLSQFDTIEFDYRSEELRLYKENEALPELENLCVVASGDLKMLGSLGIYVTDVYVGQRGPVSMIVDTGGSNTFLSWKGVSDLGLSRDSKGVYRITDQVTGAMGNTGQAFALTHRMYVSSQLQLVGRSSQSPSKPNSLLPGLDLSGINRLGIDIGDIPLLQSLASQNVGGILGLDVFTRCAAVCLKLKGQRKTLTLFSEPKANL